MSDESDSIISQSHLVNEEIDQAKSLFSRKREEFSRLIRGRQSNPCFSDELGTSLFLEDVTEANNRLVALRSKPNGDCLFNVVSIDCEQSLFCSKICGTSADAICERRNREPLETTF